jgi:4'-phosphopantetheinyl transferase
MRNSYSAHPERSGDLALRNDEVHVWEVWTDRIDADLPAFNQILAFEEQERAARFKFAKDRRRYVLAHAALRQILARYLQTDAARLKFRVGAHGKPELVPPANRLLLQFNLSHSHEAALIAVTHRRQIGVDVEYIKRDFAWVEIAERFFSPAEVAKLQALAPELQQRAFFACWTRKEAYIKAKGGGLSIPLQDFEVSLAPKEPPALLAHRGDPEEVNRWRFSEIEAGLDYAAALAVEGRDWNLHCFRWPETSAVSQSRK